MRIEDPRELVAPVSGRVCWGAGLIALDVLVSAGRDSPYPMSAGGSCGNVLAILSWLGWRSYPLAYRATDAAGKLLWTDMERFGVSCDHLAESPEVRTPLIVEYHRIKKGIPAHRFDFVCPDCKKWFPRYRPPRRNSLDEVLARLVSPNVFYFDRLSAGLLAVARAAKARGAWVMFEPSPGQDARLVRQAFSVSDIVKFSGEVDAKPKWWTDDLECVGSPLVIETLGDRGVRYALLGDGRAAEWKSLEAFRLFDVVDTAGAGDWCAAWLIHTLLGEEVPSWRSEERIVDALRFAQALAGLSCQFLGARGAMYSLAPDEIVSAAERLVKNECTPVGSDSGWEGEKKCLSEVCPNCSNASS